MTIRNTNERMQELAKKWLAGTITEPEKLEFEQWYNDFDDSQLEDISGVTVSGLKERLYQAILEKENIPVQSTVKRLALWPRIAAAAAILIFFGIGLYVYTHQTTKSPLTAHNAPKDIPPGSNKATLTLANGQKIVLSEAHNGIIANQGKTLINKTTDGQVVYSASAPSPLEKAGDEAYNTLTTKRGEQYPLVLGDGTKVWLNAASSITYPVAFTGKERKVTITGEAYFEVAHNAAKPFRVLSNGQTVEVLGTHFNINSYTDEPAIKTTLLEGSVKVSDENGGAIIKPGEQAIMKNNTISVVKTDVDDAIAWKNGLTTFDNADIYAVMRQVARWYDIKVTFEGTIPTRHFSGAVSRNVNLSEVLKILELSKIHFHVGGKTIIVTP